MLTKFSTHGLQLVNPVVRFRSGSGELQLQGLWTIIPRQESDGTYTVCFRFLENQPGSPESEVEVKLQNQDVDDSYW